MIPPRAANDGSKIGWSEEFIVLNIIIFTVFIPENTSIVFVLSVIIILVILILIDYLKFPFQLFFLLGLINPIWWRTS